MTGKGRRGQAPQRLASDASHALDMLYRRHAKWLNRVLASRFKSSALDVDDLVQETYVRVARYDADDAAQHPKALLLRIATNLARDHMRRNVVRGGLADPEGSCAGEPRIGADQHAMLALKEAILALPPIYRDVFVLHRFSGLTYEEIASHVGISVKAVEWRMSKALAMCAAQLRD